MRVRERARLEFRKFSGEMRLPVPSVTVLSLAADNADALENVDNVVNAATLDAERVGCAIKADLLTRGLTELCDETANEER
jgi:hypothetical protein